MYCGTQVFEEVTCWRKMRQSSGSRFSSLVWIPLKSKRSPQWQWRSGKNKLHVKSALQSARDIKQRAPRFVLETWKTVNVTFTKLFELVRRIIIFRSSILSAWFPYSVVEQSWCARQPFTHIHVYLAHRLSTGPNCTCHADRSHPLLRKYVFLTRRTIDNDFQFRLNAES